MAGLEISECSSCGWVGHDNEEAVFSDGTMTLCMSCRYAVAVGNDFSKTGDVPPVVLVSLIRLCVSQSVSAMLAQIIQRLADGTGSSSEDISRKLHEAILKGTSN